MLGWAVRLRGRRTVVLSRASCTPSSAWAARAAASAPLACFNRVALVLRPGWTVRNDGTLSAQGMNFVGTVRTGLPRWPCGVPQRRAAGRVVAPASPVPRASRRFVTSTFPRAVLAWHTGPSPTAACLTHQSSGHTTAGVVGTLRQGWARRCVPLTSHVSPPPEIQCAL